MDYLPAPDAIPPAPEETPVAVPLPRRGWNLVAWPVILGVVGLFLFGRNLVDRTDAVQGQQNRRLQIALLELQGRYLVGVGDIMGMPGPDLFRQAEALDDGSAEAGLRVAVLAGEFLGPGQASQRLAGLVLITDEEIKTGKILRALSKDLNQGRYALPSLTNADREFLTEHLGWFGRLAMNPRGVPVDQEKLAGAIGAPGALEIERQQPDLGGRQAALGPAHQAVSAILGGLCSLGTLGLGGLVGLIILLVLACKGRLQPGVEGEARHGGIYAESFALWLGLYFGLSFLLGGQVLTNLPPLLRSSVFSLGSMVCLAWPVVRGVSWKQVRQDIGLNLGRQPTAEPGWGLLGYAMTLPLLAVGAFLSILLMMLQRKSQGEPPMFGAPSDPTHPIMEFLIYGDAATRWQVFFLACVEAPLIEEIMFRGLLYRNARSMTCKMGRGWSFILSGLLVSFVFAAIHPQGWTAIPALMALALGFTMLREWRGSLVSAMVAHGVSNGIVFGVALLAFGG